MKTWLYVISKSSVKLELAGLRVLNLTAMQVVTKHSATIEQLLEERMGQQVEHSSLGDLPSPGDRQRLLLRIRDCIPGRRKG
jgi:hypothetical protein